MQAFHGLQTFSIYSTVKLPAYLYNLNDSRAESLFNLHLETPEGSAIIISSIEKIKGSSGTAALAGLETVSRCRKASVSGEIARLLS